MTPVEEYLRQAALVRGMDPDIVIRAAKSEGGLKDPFRQSDVITGGRREPSYGPLQLLVGGPGTGFPSGLGNAAIAAGIDPRKNWKGGIDFALDTVAREGWKQWYGPRKAGIGRWDGVRGAKPMGMTLTSAPTSSPASAGMAPPLPPPTEVRDYPIAEVAAADPVKQGFDWDALKGILGGKNPDGTDNTGFAGMMEAMGGGGESAGPDIQPSSVGPAVSNEIAAKAASAQALMQQLMASKRKGRVPGLSLMG